MNKWWLYKEVSGIKRVSLFTENGGKNVRMNKNEGLDDPYFYVKSLTVSRKCLMSGTV